MAEAPTATTATMATATSELKGGVMTRVEKSSCHTIRFKCVTAQTRPRENKSDYYYYLYRIPTPRLKYKTVFQCDRCLVTSDKEQSRLRCPCHAERFQKWRTYFWPFRNGCHRGTVRALHLSLGEYYDTVDCTRLYDHFY